MSVHVLLNLSNEFEEKRSNARLAEYFIPFFCNEFNKFNNTRAHMLGYIYLITLNYFKSKKGGKDQEAIQSSTTTDPEYHMGK